MRDDFQEDDCLLVKTILLWKTTDDSIMDKDSDSHGWRLLLLKGDCFLKYLDYCYRFRANYYGLAGLLLI